MSKLLLAAFVSASFRSANIQPNPNDFEYAIGIENTETDISGLIERENGIRYKGFELMDERKYTVTHIFYKQAQRIDKQGFTVKYPFDNFSIGFSLNTIAWEDMQVLQYMKYETEYAMISYEIGENRQFITAKVSKKLSLNNKIYIEPLMQFYRENINDKSKDFWSTKLLVGYKFNREGG